MAEWRKRMPSKRQLTAQFDKFVQQKSVEVLYSPHEQERIRQMTAKIKKATCEFECDEDWERIIQVVDALGNISNRAVLKESIRYLRIRLADPSPRVVILALTLTEAVVKNCGALVHAEIATESFMHQMEALHKTHVNKRGRDSLEITDRVLEMIQSWGEAFLPHRHKFPLFIDTYHNMRKKGVKFPKQYDESRVPVLTPPTSNQHDEVVEAQDEQPESNMFGDLSGKEIVHVASNIAEMFDDMIHEARKSASSISSTGVIQELASQARELVRRLESVIQTAAAQDDEDLGRYLSVNDALVSALTEFRKLRFSTQQASPGCPTSLATTSPHDFSSVDGRSGNETTSSNQADNDDDPFAEFVRERVTKPQGRLDEAPKESELVTETPQDEEDPFASFVKERVSKPALDNQVSPPKPASQDLIDLWDDAPSVQAASNQIDIWGSNDSLTTSNTTAPTPAALLDKHEWVNPSLEVKAGTSCVPVSISSSDSIFDDFLASPNTVTSNATPASHATPNPFDVFDNMAMTPNSKVSQPTSAPAKSFNPFDM